MFGISGFRILNLFGIWSLGFGIYFLEIGASLADDEGQVLPILRRCAERLGWERDVFISPKKVGEDFQVFGIANIPFTYFSTQREKAHIQWLSSEHRFPLEKVLDQHLESYRNLGFQISPLEGLGVRAYRAYLLSYGVKGPQGVELSQSSDVVEILTPKKLLTVSDERLDPHADAGSIFIKVHDLVLGGRLPKVALQKELFSNLPPKIDLVDLFPQAGDFSDGDWALGDVDFQSREGEVPTVGMKYHKLKKEGKVSEPVVTVLLFVHGSHAKAKYVYERNLKFLEFKPLAKNKSLFLQDIFICDVRVKWKGASKMERNKLLDIFSSAIRKKIQEAFSESRNPQSAIRN